MALVHIVISQQESDEEWPYTWNTEIIGAYNSIEDAKRCVLSLKQQPLFNHKVFRIKSKEVS